MTHRIIAAAASALLGLSLLGCGAGSDRHRRHEERPERATAGRQGSFP